MSRSSVTHEKTVPVLYCDIDGTIRYGFDELGRFVNAPKDVLVFKGVSELLWTYKQLGWRIVGISNQGGIALGHLDMTTCKAAMKETHKQTGYAFDKLTWCMHHPDAPDPEMATCWCRKPKPGMIIESALAMAEEHPGEIYPPHLALVVGDREEDVGVANNSGIRFMSASQWRAGTHLAEITSDVPS